MDGIGFKTITQENWLQPDPAMSVFAWVTRDEQSQMTGNDWLPLVLEPRLDEAVPSDVQALFGVARGALAYGYFFYPLYTLGIEQLFRVAEAAVDHKCKVSEASKSRKTFEKKIEWLVNKSIISKSDSEQWEAIRKFRNYSSHPERQMIILPTNAIDILKRIVEKINSLFSE